MKYKQEGIKMNNDISNENNMFSKSKKRSCSSIIRHVVGGLLFAAFIALIFAILVKLLWNGIMPAVFDLRTISFWQAFCIILLAKLIFGGVGPRHSFYHPGRSYYHSKDRRYLSRWIHNGYRFEDDELNAISRRKKWEYYKQYWRDEGKEAFEAYIKKIEKESKE